MLSFYNLVNNVVYGISGEVKHEAVIKAFKEGYIVHIAEDFNWLPSKATEKSHGLDCRVKIKDSKIVRIDSESKKKTIICTDNEFYTMKDNYYRFDLGIRLLTPDYLRPELKPRSSLAAKKGLLFATSGIIDNDYFEPLLFGTFAVRNDKLEDGERIAQLIYYGDFQKYLRGKEGLIFQVVDSYMYNNLPEIMDKYGLKTDRDGGYGHTGSK